ncbi:metal tolerance protein C4-like isoform X1 [Hibiscus syriacus]|uniref:metal tolerance protein C4-like isoform X1 n=1 Tax=Hibiscus syriacus TaxID=106335 RepID=UPI00192457DD|nr:metal tolerance protein C4-like isoform X1 [Hibiscus syriacus]XP_039070835.1 metal tolerance protein C4-like isoform X1 [Hibiscus syriacus]
MQTSCRFISRFLRSSKHISSSIIVNSSFNSLSRLDFVNPQTQGFFKFSPYTTNSGQIRGSKHCILLGFALPADDSANYQHHPHFYSSYRTFFTRAKPIKKIEITDQHSQRAVTTALWCNFLVFSLKFGVWLATSSHVMLAEMVHSLADFANQALLAYGLSSSRRAPDALHPYGYSKERFVWSLISAVGIFCLGSGATIIHGVQNLWIAHPPDNIEYAALVIGGSFIIEGASLVVAIQAVKKGAAAEGMKVKDYIWRGHDPTSVAVMTEDGAAVTGLAIAAASLVAVKTTGNAIYDPIGSIIVGNLLGMVAVFLIQRNRHALIGRAIDDNDMQKVLHFLKNDPVVDALYDCKSEVIGPGFFRFKAEIDFNGEVVVQNYLKRTGREEWARQFRESAKEKDDSALLKIMSNYGEEVVTALGSEVDRLEKEIQELVPGIRHVDIEAHNPIDLSSS